MHTPDTIKSQLIKLGVNKCNALMLHVSLRKIGPIQGGPDALLDTIINILPKKSALLMPLGSEDDEPFDAQTSKAEKEIGALAEIFRCRPGTIVNDHVAGRFGSTGTLSQYLLNPTPLNDYYGPGSLLERFTQINGSVLRIGADLDTVTLTHYAEYLANIPNKKRINRRYNIKGKGISYVESLDDCNGIVDCPKGDYFSLILIDYMNEKRAKIGKVGNANSELINAQDYIQYSVNWLETNL